MAAESGSVTTTEPPANRIPGSVVVPRKIHLDPRGMLVETLREDDVSAHGDRFAMSYTSVTVPGQMRDRDRWHVHLRQEDRFVVALGEMVLALFDARPQSPTHGRLELLRMAGAPVSSPNSPAGGKEATTYLVSIPVGVYHAIGNLHPSEPFVLQNYPTSLYDATDEGRVPFAEVKVPRLGDRPFSWDRVRVQRP